MRILIAGKTAALRNALKRFMQRRCECEVVGTAVNKEQLFNLIETDSPDLLLLDESLAENIVQEIIMPIRQRDPSPEVIVLGIRSETEQVYLAGGAAAFVNKSAPPKSLLTAVEEIRLRGSSA